MRPAPAALLAAVVWLCHATPAGAAFVPWKYSWTSSPGTLTSDTSASSYITLSDEALRSASGSSDIVATNLDVFSDADPGNPATFTNKAYTLTLFLLDVDSAESGSLDFTGLINGSISMFSADLENTFTGETTQTLDLGTNTYVVTIGPYTPPGPPGSQNSGAIGAQTKVSVTVIHKTPEPSTLALALYGAGSLLGYRFRRRRRRNTTPVAASGGSA